MPRNIMQNNIFFKELGKKLKNTRRKCGKTQGDMASHLGVSFQQVQKYEKSVNKIPLDKIIVWANITDTNISYFISSENNNIPEINKFFIKFYNIFENLSNKQQLAIYGLMNAMKGNYENK